MNNIINSYCFYLILPEPKLNVWNMYKLYAHEKTLISLLLCILVIIDIFKNVLCS